MNIHVVRSGDTIASIANNYGASEGRIIRDNEIKDPTQLVVGQTIVIMYPNEVHIVQPGENLFVIAEEYGTDWITILQNNPSIISPDAVFPGQELVINYAGEKLGETTVNGYAYPNIDLEVLRKTLPYLTYISIFTYGFTPEGEIIDIDDEEIINIAREYRVAPLMQLSNYTEEGIFSNDLASTIFYDMAAQNQLIDNILANMRTKNYHGLDIDFEYILPADRQGFVDFVNNVTTRLNDEGYEVMIALAPKIAADQVGVLYEAHDYEQIGQIVNWALLMTYEWGYTYGEPMAVAPIDKVREVLDYAITDIEPSKIRMGMPNYGYDWKLPFVRGESRARVVGNVEAVDQAREENVAIEFDEVSMAPFYTYYDENRIEHVVWFEDARSIDAKIRLVDEYGFNGLSYWTIMRYFPQNWLVVNSLYNIIKEI